MPRAREEAEGRTEPPLLSLVCRQVPARRARRRTIHAIWLHQRRSSVDHGKY